MPRKRAATRTPQQLLLAWARSEQPAVKRARQRADYWQAAQALAKTPDRRIVDGIALLIQTQRQPAKVARRGVQLRLGVGLRRSCILLRYLSVEGGHLVEHEIGRGAGSNSARYFGRVPGVITCNFARDHVGMYLRAQRAVAEVEPP